MTLRGSTSSTRRSAAAEWYSASRLTPTPGVMAPPMYSPLALMASTVVATGGFSSLIAPYSDTIEHVEPWLTLHGLRIVYERNVPS